MFRFFALALVLSSLIENAGAQSVPAATAMTVPPQQIWFSPRQHWRPDTGIDDWDDLFKSDAAWPKAAANVKVFKFTEGVILTQSESQLRTMAQFLADHHIQTTMEVGGINREPNSKKPGGEGYDSVEELRAACKRMKKVGLTLDYLSMDEALWFGHYDKSSPQAENYSVPDLVTHVATNIRAVISEFPGVHLVNIETVPPESMQPDFDQIYPQYIAALQEAGGKPIECMQLDVAWKSPSAGKDIQRMQKLAHSLNMQFGIIYDSDEPGTSGRQFNTRAEALFTKCESELGVIPEQPVFQSWDAHYPAHALPETDPESHTYLITRYLLPRTQIVAQRAAGNTVQGELADQQGRPIPGATVSLRVPALDPAKAPPIQSVSGTVPANAKTAIFAVRVNTECLCDGDNDFLIGPLTYRESGTSTFSKTDDYPALLEKNPPKGGKRKIETRDGMKIAHVTLPSGQTIGYNSGKFPVTPGASFVLQVPSDLISGEGLYGKVMVIWFDDKGHAVHADDIAIERQYIDAGPAVTGADGRYSIPIPAQGSAGPLRLTYAGSATLRPSLKAVP